MPPAGALAFERMVGWCQCLAVVAVEGTQQQGNGWLIIDGTQRTAALWAERPARIVRRPEGRRCAARAGPGHPFPGELDPRQCQRATVALAQFARAGMGIGGRPSGLEANLPAQAAAPVDGCCHRGFPWPVVRDIESSSSMLSHDIQQHAF